MPAAYLDTSALVKRYVTEVGSVWVRRTLARPEQQVIYTTLLAQPEVLSALQRKVREGSLAATEAQRLARRVQRHFAWRYRCLSQLIIPYWLPPTPKGSWWTIRCGIRIIMPNEQGDLHPWASLNAVVICGKSPREECHGASGDRADSSL